MLTVIDARNKQQGLTDSNTTSPTHMMIHPDEGGAKASDSVPPLPDEGKGLDPPTRKREISSVSDEGEKKRKLSVEEEKMEARRAANRRSALESRKRRKILIGTYHSAALGCSCLQWQ